MKKLFTKPLLSAIISFAFLAIGLAVPLQIEAATITQKIDRRLELKGDHVQVQETINTTVQDGFIILAGQEIIFRVFNPIINDTRAQEKINITLPSVKLTYGGVPLPFTTEIDGQDILIKAKYPSSVTGKDKTIVITYNSYALTSKTGAVYDMYIPSFSKDFEFESEKLSLGINTTVVIPKRFGDINFVTPEVEVTENESNRIMKFTREDLTGVIAWVQIGTTQYYEFEIMQPYNASGDTGLFENEYELLIPRDIDAGPLEQRVFYSDISPTPEHIRQDEEGNLIATFKLPSNDKGTIILRGYIEVRDNKNPAIENAGQLSDIPPDILGAYTAGAEFWEVQAPDIQSVANQLKGDRTDVYEIMTTTYSYVVDLIDYSEVKRFGINERQGALKTLQGGAAVCMEYSDLFIALMRAQGVPARAAFGYGYDPRTTNGVDTAHQWAEVYIPNLDEWVLVDTTWGETGTEIVGGDLNHFYKYVAARSPQDPAPVSVKFFGNLGEIPEEDFVITAIEAPPKLSGERKFLTQPQLLEEYFYTDPDSNPITAFINRFTKTASNFNAQVDAALLNDYGVEDGNRRQLLRLSIYVLPFLIFLILMLLWMAINNRRAMEQAQKQQPASKAANISYSQGRPL